MTQRSTSDPKTSVAISANYYNIYVSSCDTDDANPHNLDKVNFVAIICLGSVSDDASMPNLIKEMLRHILYLQSNLGLMRMQHFSHEDKNQDI